MGKHLIVWFWIIMLIVIHTIDMELTGHYIGNDWQKEGFPIMSFSIKTFGISSSLWFSRVFMYLFMYYCALNVESRAVRLFLILITLLYWTAMFNWLFVLGFLHW
jgi:hypothetical protein